MKVRRCCCLCALAVLQDIIISLKTETPPSLTPRHAASPASSSPLSTPSAASWRSSAERELAAGAAAERTPDKGKGGLDTSDASDASPGALALMAQLDSPASTSAATPPGVLLFPLLVLPRLRFGHLPLRWRMQT